MTMTRKLFLPLAAIAFVGYSQAFATGTATSTFTTNAHIDSSCTMSVADLDFGAYDPFAAGALTGKTDVTVTCTRGAVPTIAMDNGSHFNGSLRAMITGTGGAGNELSYELFQPDAVGPSGALTTVAWGSTGVNVFNAGSAPDKNARTVKLFGSIPAGQDSTVGTYADSVTATVNF